MTCIRNTKGFTIVELLIAIVVIAILASISMVAFGGMQQRAANAAGIADARKMKSLVEQYITINGGQALTSLVPPSNFMSYCIGEGYTDVDPGSELGCYDYQDTYDNTSYPINSVPALDTALSQIGDYSVSKLPPLSYEDDWAHWSDGNTYQYTESYTAPLIRILSNGFVDGKRTYAIIWYTLAGDDEDCMLKPQLGYETYYGGSNPRVEYPTTSSKNAGYLNGVTWCEINISAN